MSGPPLTAMLAVREPRLVKQRMDTIGSHRN